jgi:hypothetical protein
LAAHPERGAECVEWPAPRATGWSRHGTEGGAWPWSTGPSLPSPQCLCNA